VGTDGTPRELHVAQALEVIGWELGPRGEAPAPPARHGANAVQQLVACPYFRLERMALEEAEQAVNDGITFHVLFVRRGSVTVEAGGQRETLSHGTSCLLPAACPTYTLSPMDGPATVLRVTGPE
jgi:mannose-6-phosphate isomerase